jgi:predicted HTH transcriptional regulator
MPMAIPTSDLPGHRGLRDRVFAALDTCVESQSVDFKESAPWPILQHKIIRTVLAMANLRDGGILVIGASESGERWDLTGIAGQHLATYDVDDIVDSIHRFASPSVSVSIVLVPYHNGRNFLTIQAFEFAETPIVCRRDGPPGSGLKQGAVYVRPAGVARTTEVRSAEQMHDLLELAAEKRARRILETAQRIGMQAKPAKQPFDDELGGL